MNENIQNKETAKLLFRLPMKYHDKVDYITREYDLVDNCKYMLYFKDEVKWCGEYYNSLPVKSITEAIKYIKEVE